MTSSQMSSLLGCNEGSATETSCVPAAAQPVLNPGGQSHLPHRRLELISLMVHGNLDEVLMKHFHSLKIIWEISKTLLNLLRPAFPSLL